MSALVHPVAHRSTTAVVVAAVVTLVVVALLAVAAVWLTGYGAAPAGTTLRAPLAQSDAGCEPGYVPSAC